MRILDLFCGGGGAGEGYRRAGFSVTGVDIQFQRDYPCTFVQFDALKLNYEQLAGFDAIHASPDCHAYSVSTYTARKHGKTYPDLYQQTKALCVASGLPYVIENVVGSPLRGNVKRFCGTQFGLGVFRHRLFETNWPLMLPAVPCTCKKKRIGADGYVCCVSDSCTKYEAQRAMQINWIRSKKQLMQAIPPAYTHFIGQQLLRFLNKSVDAHNLSSGANVPPGANVWFPGASNMSTRSA